MKKWVKDGLIGWGAGAVFYIIASSIRILSAGDEMSMGRIAFAICFSFLPSFLGGWFLGGITKKTWPSVVGGILPSVLVWVGDILFSQYIFDLSQWQ